jgi:hypothetical protein
MVPYDVPLVTMDMMYRFMGLDHHIVNKLPSRIESEVSSLYLFLYLFNLREKLNFLFDRNPMMIKINRTLSI